MRYSPKNISQRWTPKLNEAGCTPISDIFLKHYAELNPPITTAEAMIIIQLIVNKCDENPPRTCFKGIAERMGITATAVRSHVRRLEKNNYLKRVYRSGSTNEFDLKPLFTRLECLADQNETNAYYIPDIHQTKPLI